MLKFLLIFFLFNLKNLYTEEFFKKEDSVLIVLKKDKFENISRFNYYTLNNDLIIYLSKKIEPNVLKVISNLNSFFSTSTDEEIKAYAKLFNCNKIVVIDTNYSFKSNLNVFSLGYLTVIGIFFFPGNSLAVDLALELSIIDTKKGELVYNNKYSSSSSKYLYRLGNSQAVLYSAIDELNHKIINVIKLGKENIL